MNRRNLLVSASLGFGLPSLVRAQRPPRKIGVLVPNPPIQNDPYAAAFEEAMQGLGYARGRDYEWIELYAQGRIERLPELADELVRRGVDVIVAASTNAAAAAQQATNSIPIVFSGVSDPVRARFADSLAHPGHNMTGLTNLTADISPKRLQLLKLMVPRLVRVAYLANPTNLYFDQSLERMHAAADQMGLSIQLVKAGTREELESGFRAMTEQHAEALLVTGDVYLFVEGQRIADLALASRLPSMFAFHESVEAGGLMCYGIDQVNAWRQLARFIDEIFRGARPGDLPIQQPLKIDLVINRRTADALGLAIPRELAMQAARVIQ
ncbi:MAG: ABC transporter substrate-binding protein [Proteobacteria bacterium]|nr:ABC transporter substrate-binding protein [Pseudomonadota bacterium]